MESEGYKAKIYSDRTHCNIQGRPECGYPGAVGSRHQLQAGASGGYTAANGMGVATDIGPVRSTNGACAVMMSTCLVGGPIAGYSGELTVLSISAGSPSSGWSVGLIKKAATPIGGCSVSLSFGSDGVGLQAGHSFTKVCAQEKVARMRIKRLGTCCRSSSAP